MQSRIAYPKVAPGAYKAMLELEEYLRQGRSWRAGRPRPAIPFAIPSGNIPSGKLFSAARFSARDAPCRYPCVRMDHPR
jgi:hypothetical protein